MNLQTVLPFTPPSALPAWEQVYVGNDVALSYTVIGWGFKRVQPFDGAFL